jgi:sporulation protein YlmC with PRC-barrel domain
MDLVRDLLDKLVVDRHGRELGRVDRVVLDVDGRSARVVAIEVGPSALAARLSPALGSLVEGIEHALALEQPRPMRIPLSDVLSIGDHVKADVAFGETPASGIERRLRRLVRAIPGGG